jgi:hypothetical protein
MAKGLLTIILFFLCLTFIFADETPVETPDEAKTVQADIRKCSTALYSGDADTILAYTHSKIIEKMGGKVKAKEELTKILAGITEKGMKIESLEFPEPPKFFNGKTNNFVIVPTLSIVSLNGKKVESQNFQLGVKLKGENKWTYIEGSRVNYEFLNQLFDDFPENIEFPKCTRKKL